MHSGSKAVVKETENGLMVIPPAEEYDELMKNVPVGKVTTQTEIRDFFAKKYKADFCCPLVTGILVNIVAGKAEEDVTARGIPTDQITPYWRTLRPGGELNPKYPGGAEAQADRLRSEGFEIQVDRKGRVKRVLAFGEKLVKF